MFLKWSAGQHLYSDNCSTLEKILQRMSIIQDVHYFLYRTLTHYSFVKQKYVMTVVCIKW